MTLHDELLSFQIKETVFLTSDRAGIGELKELELLPDVEIIENPQEISITGCLQLYGKYEPARSAQVDEAGGAETLLSAMKFTPFSLEEQQQADYYGNSEQNLAHRIPLNITIPMSRIKEVGEIYAIVDSLDYDVKTPVELQIQAVLKLSGIVLKDQQETNPESQEVWDYLHVTGQEEQQEAEPVSLEEIERKLARLEQEVEQRRLEQTEPPAPYLAEDVAKDWLRDYRFVQPEPDVPVQHDVAVDDAGSDAASELPPETRGKLVDFRTYQRGGADGGEHAKAGGAIEPAAARFAGPQPEREGFADQGDQQATAARGKPAERTDGKQAANAGTKQDGVPQPAAQPKPAGGTPAKGNDGQEPSVAAVSTPQEEETTAAGFAAKQLEPSEPTVTGEQVESNAVEDLQEPAVPAADADEAEPVSSEVNQREFKVAISGKPSKEQEEPLNLTSIFAHARRTSSEQEAVQPEGESAAEAAEQGEGNRSSESETVEKLTSFVRGEAESFSKLKMCIIQRDETIQEIAERYSLPVSRILEVNNLSSERLVAGQVLYIPQ